MAVALGRVRFGRGAENGRSPWRHDNHGLGGMLGDSVVNIVLVVGAIHDDGGERLVDLAAMVKAGFTAAEVGRKLASTTNRFGTSKALQKGSSGAWAGSFPMRIVPHWCDGVRRSNGLASTIGNPAARNTSRIFVDCGPRKASAVKGVW